LNDVIRLARCAHAPTREHVEVGARTAQGAADVRRRDMQRIEGYGLVDDAGDHCRSERLAAPTDVTG
jgi:hypothetical protein